MPAFLQVQLRYYPFGMQMPGRSASSGSYRYGFNGKENDNEIKGEGNQQDYGMRIYNPRLGKFLSVDPLAAKYPELTPYQFASNRPIDGVDLDGMEYLTYTFTLNLTGKKGTVMMNNYFNWYDNNQHNVHGPLGRGVLYNIKFYRSDKQEYVGQYSFFVSRNASVLGLKSEYGNYMGATSLFKLDNEGQTTREYDYTLPAVDVVDNYAKMHDMEYDKLGAVGANGLFDDWGTTPLDENALNGWRNFRANYKVGDADPYSGQSVTKEARNAAWNGATLFSMVVGNKKKAISDFMINNYESESQHSSSLRYGNVANKNQREHNYQLFLNKYMEKDNEGNWNRKNGMWTQDKEGNWTPNKPSKG